MQACQCHGMKRLTLPALVLLAACATVDPASIQMSPRPVAQTQGEVDFVKSLFADIQGPSIRESREYCGLIGLDASGAFVATEPRPGRVASCLPPAPANVDFTVVASYHTHGSYSPRFVNEMPSIDDMTSDIADNTDGYVATPGGRLWYIDARARVARLICNAGCLQSDPAYPGSVVPRRITMAQLQAM